MNFWHDFWSAWVFMTRIPAPITPPWHDKTIVNATAHFPLIGALVGAMCGLTFYGASHLWNSMIGAVLSLVLGALLTGAMHEDGLADTCDGLWGGFTPDRRREILKDSRIGAYGSLAIVLSALLKFAALASLGPIQGFFALIFAHCLGRILPAMLMCSLPYGGNTANAKSTYTAGVPIHIALIASFWGIAACTIYGFCCNAWVWLALPLILLIWAGSRALFINKLGGYTGDTLGASEQITEIALLLLWFLL